jgi:hypothetical protein
MNNHQNIVDLMNDNARLKDALASARKALEEIACFRDEGANERLAKTGSYGSFDEPGSVKIAREFLAVTDDLRKPHPPGGISMEEAAAGNFGLTEDDL